MVPICRRRQPRSSSSGSKTVKSGARGARACLRPRHRRNCGQRQRNRSRTRMRDFGRRVREGSRSSSPSHHAHRARSALCTVEEPHTCPQAHGLTRGAPSRRISYALPVYAPHATTRARHARRGSCSASTSSTSPSQRARARRRKSEKESTTATTPTSTTTTATLLSGAAAGSNPQCPSWARRSTGGTAGTASPATNTTSKTTRTRPRTAAADAAL
jgi:hypothetical protein